MILIVAVMVGLIPVVPAVIVFLRERDRVPTKATRNLVLGLNSFNVLLGLMATGIGIVWLFSPGAAMAAGLQQEAAVDPYATLAAAISTGLACVGAGIAVASSGAAAVGAIAEKP